MLESKYLKNKLLLNLFASLLFLFVLFNSISKTYAVDCTPPSIDASCDLNTTTSNLFVGSNPESLELNINANVKGSSYQSVLVHITSILGTNAINVGPGVTISTTGYKNSGGFKLFNFQQQAAYSLTNRGTLYGSFYYASSMSNGTAAAISVANTSTVTLIDNYGSITHEIDWGIRNFGTIGTISNQSTGTLNGIANINGVAEITKIHNIGTIGANSSNNVGAIYNKNGSTIGTIRNEGSIIGYSRGSTYKDAIHNEGGSTIDVIENLGTIQGGNPNVTYFDIHNKNSKINELINAQGAATNDALTYKGALPTSYKILINSTSDYGQLRTSSVNGKMTFSIAEDSDISFDASSSYSRIDSTDTLNPATSTAYKINSDKDITIVINDDVIVAGPEHNLFIEDAANFNLTVNSGKTFKNEAGSYGGQTYEDVFAGLSSDDFTATSGTTSLDGTPITWSLSADTKDLTIESSETAQSGEVVHIDDESLVDGNITNNGTIWSTENNAIAFDNTTITGTFTITNASGATIQSDSTASDEAAILIKDTTGTVNINNVGTITSSTFGVYNNDSSVTLTNTGIIASGSGSYDVINDGTMTINNLQGASTSDPLTLTGILPSYNVMIESSSNYGQLAVTNGTGILDFNVADTTKLDVDLTYANVLSGVADEQIKDLAKTFTQSGVTYEWQLEQTSINVWQLDVASLEEIMEDNAITFPNYINKVNATLNHGVAIANFAQQNYQCNVFGENDGCFAVAGRYTDLSDPSGESQAAVFMAGYQVPEQKVRFSVFVDQSIDNSSVSGVKLENHGPMVGFKGVWQQNYDGTGMVFSVANTYQSQDAKITRKVVFEDSEQGQGSTDIETQTYRAELMYGYLYNQDTFMNPYVALQYDIAEQDGYTESASRQTSFPLTLSSVKDETTSIRAGLQIRHRLGNQKTFLFGSAGVEHDLSSSSDDQVTATYQGYSFSADLDNDTNETRANALLGVDHFVSPTQKMSILVNYQELAWGGSSSDAITGFASYTIGF